MACHWHIDIHKVISEAKKITRRSIVKHDISNGTSIIKSKIVRQNLSPQRIPRQVLIFPLIGSIIVCLQNEPRCRDVLLLHCEIENCPIKPALQLTGLLGKLSILQQQMALASAQTERPTRRRSTSEVLDTIPRSSARGFVIKTFLLFSWAYDWPFVKEKVLRVHSKKMQNC